MGEVKMKECKYCGTKRDDNAQFCPNCGASAVISEEERRKAIREEQEEQNLRDSEKRRIKPRTKLIIILCSAIALIIIGIIITISAISSHNARIEAENNRIVANGKSTNDLDRDYEEVKSLYSNGKYEEALDKIEQIPSAYKKYDDVQNTKNEIIKSYSDATIAKADEYVAAEKYSDALSLLTNAMNKTDNYQPLKSKYDEVLSSCKSTYLAKAKSYADSGDYTQAISTLETISSVIKTDADIDAKILEYKKAMINDKLAEYESAEDYVSAITYLEQELPNVSNDVDLTAKLNGYKSTYKQKILAEAETAYKTDGYEAAVAILNKALIVLPNDEEINAKISSYNSKAPVSLYSLEQYSGFGLKQYDDIFKDVTGKTYAGGYLSTDWHMDDSTVYYLDKQYNKMTGKIVFSSSYPYDQVISFYDDDTNKLLGSYTITPKSVDGENININLTNVKFLKIEVKGMSSKTAIVDATLYK